MRLAALIPARYAAQRLPGKPLADIGGVPMVVRVAQRASQAQGIDQVAVATDDQRIAAAVEGNAFIANLAYALIAFVIATRIFKNESVLFRV